MRTADKVAQQAMKALLTGQRVSPAKETKPTPEGQPRIAAMRRLWERMAAIYGHRWASAYGERCDDAKGALTIAGDTWARGLSGVAETQIGVGLNAALASADGWPPTLPEFRAMCLGVPTLAAAKLAINDPENRFSRLMWQRMDKFSFRQADADRAENMLRGAYELAREHVMRGGALPELPVAAIAASEETKRPRASEETVRAACADLEKLFGASA